MGKELGSTLKKLLGQPKVISVFKAKWKRNFIISSFWKFREKREAPAKRSPQFDYQRFRNPATSKLGFLETIVDT